jgi:hypothetical protein
MQKGDNNSDRKLMTSVDIVDTIPTDADKNTILKADDISAGTTKLNEEDLHHLFQHRNLAYLATLSKDGSPSCHSRLGRISRRLDINKYI